MKTLIKLFNINKIKTGFDHTEWVTTFRGDMRLFCSTDWLTGLNGEIEAELETSEVINLSELTDTEITLFINLLK